MQLSSMKKRLDSVKYEILVWESQKTTMIWDTDPVKASKYLKDVSEVRSIVENLKKLQWARKEWQAEELLCKAEVILQTGLARLEEEFIHQLVQRCRYSEPDPESFHLLEEDDHMHEFASESFSGDGDSSKWRRSRRTSIHQYSFEDTILSFFDTDTVQTIRDIAEVMFASGREKECCEAYIRGRKDVLEDCMFFLQIEKIPIDEIFRMDWEKLSLKLQIWNRAVKILTQTCIASEKNLCYKVFGELSESACKVCFLESSIGSFMQLLNFGEGVLIGIPSPERLFHVLDMYVQLTDLLPEIKELFPEEDTDSSCILGECHDLLEAMVEYIKGALCEFESIVHNDPSNVPPPVGGGIHPLTRYVMNYLGLLVGYNETLDSILADMNDNNDCQKKNFSIKISPVAWIFQLITAILVSNLSTKSMLYEEESLQHLFMMNNINYMVKRVNDTLRKLVGDDWVRAHTSLYRKHAVYFERTSWNSILGYLTAEGLKDSTSSSSSAAIVKQKLKSFNHNFERMYSTQTAWQIPNEELREEMRISISVKVIQAYRSFVGIYGNQIESDKQKRRYIKFCSEDIQSYLLDLFEGKSRTLRRRSRQDYHKD